MTDANTPTGTETPEQKALRDSMKDAEKQASSSNGGIMDAIKGFLKFLWEIFFPSKDAPDEEPEKPRQPVSIMEQARLGTLIIQKQTIPNWKKFQEKHEENGGGKVEHTNPVEGGFREITRDKGRHKHPEHGDMRSHDGVDLKARKANPNIMASAEGVVLFAGEKSGYGNTVILGHADGSWTLYAHMRDKPNENMIGDTVARGQTIGVMGETGVSKGVHLHYEQGYGDKRTTPRLAGVGELKNGVQYAAGADKSNPLAGLVERDPKYPVRVAQQGNKPRPIIVAGKTDMHHGHSHS